MRILAIDTATEACSVALLSDGAVSAHFEECPREHTQRILPLVKDILTQGNTALTDLDALAFGYSGVALAAGSLLGALLNHRLLRRNVSLGRILAIACILHFVGGVAVYVLRESIWFVAPVALVTLAWAMAIPLVLGSALSAYGDCRGTAGAFFGLFYYVLIGAGLLAAGWGQSLGASLLACAGVSMLAGWRYIIVLNKG